MHSEKSLEKEDQQELPLEKKIKELLELIISQLENYVKTPEEAQIIEKMLHDYDSLSDLVDITIEIFTYFVKKIETKIKKLKTYKFIVSAQNENSESNGSKATDYVKLETQMQKYEAEIRNHIKIEQQLKLYTESIQEKLDEQESKENEMIAQTKMLEKQVFELGKKNNELDEKLKNSSKQNDSLQKQLSKLEENYCIIFGGHNQVDSKFLEKYNQQISLNNRMNSLAQSQQSLLKSNDKRKAKMYKKYSTSHSKNRSSLNYQLQDKTPLTAKVYQQSMIQDQVEAKLRSSGSSQNRLFPQSSCENLNTFYTLLKKQNYEAKGQTKDNKRKKDSSHSQTQRQSIQNKEQQKFINLINNWSKNKSKQLTNKVVQEKMKNFEKASQYIKKNSKPFQSSKYASVNSNRSKNQNKTGSQELLNAFMKFKSDDTQQYIAKSFCSNNPQYKKKHNSQMKLKQQINQQPCTHKRSKSSAGIINSKQINASKSSQLQSLQLLKSFRFQ